jgi:hypothetical protein
MTGTSHPCRGRMMLNSLDISTGQGHCVVTHLISSESEGQLEPHQFCTMKNRKIQSKMAKNRINDVEIGRWKQVRWMVISTHRISGRGFAFPSMIKYPIKHRGSLRCLTSRYSEIKYSPYVSAGAHVLFLFKDTHSVIDILFE